jgi:restriction endonuclease S subunit
MKVINFKAQEHARHWISLWSTFEVPVPPIEVQREIVSILDTFTQLEAELEAELEARQQQYFHYRNALLNFSGEVVRVPLGQVLDVLMDHRGKTPKKLGGDWTSHGHRVISALNVKGGLVDDNDHHYVSNEIYAKWMTSQLKCGDVLLTSEAPLGAVAFLPEDVDWAIGQRLFALRAKPERLESRFLFHLLAGGAPRKELLMRSTGSTVLGIRQAELVKVLVPLPSLVEQRRIAGILDSFDALTSGLTFGLPAEIQARRKQYEYYRDKLLTFKELDVA